MEDKKVQHQNEMKLVAAAKRNREHFGVIYEHYHEQIFRFIYKRIQDESASADVTQMAFMKAMTNIDKFEDRGYPFSSWLYRIALNEVNSYYRQNKKLNEIDLSESQAQVLVDDMDMAVTDSRMMEMVAAINNLEPEQAEMLELRFFEKMSFREISQLYDITEENAKTKVYRILKRLKKMINLTSGKQ